MRLRDLDQVQPELDLMVILVEPTFGETIFLSELKCPEPPRWAKDQVNILNKDCVSKAFRQVEAKQRFMTSKEAIRFLARILPKD